MLLGATAQPPSTPVPNRREQAKKVDFMRVDVFMCIHYQKKNCPHIIDNENYLQIKHPAKQRLNRVVR
ncbi:hypothetical protein XNC1_2650 [Xenorhabdus nematophila ATCC 19061]|uniref:Uncharacterized protein n=1 Tax=Xenorhabdus nematophila (strain ATCC 19061 / DSM 3370 / CCUG 14189 / LMG 1036 / NCIMB 9965 / AN6) TaxID=406817 RepID=D3VI64_XENNA|nr:hypothetical protein XNC1_2650 [Xenorhabdus nematophila ATCC 19061]CEE94892.1 hypothetical protein XNA1_4830021 [Xenorhabdus nematophila str. Anatoliense]CEF29325.1 hypothetical protein XNW1_1680027 [Xenorhabdus nematophila str. Websteri]CEK23543.1 hypothetical protein XNC2_2549 [Xenorhabdus nematophila AN6/1]